MSVKVVSIPTKPKIWKKYVVYLPLKIVWHICERPPCEKIMIYSRRCNKTCTAHIQILKKKVFSPIPLINIYLCMMNPGKKLPKYLFQGFYCRFCFLPGKFWKKDYTRWKNSYTLKESQRWLQSFFFVNRDVYLFKKNKSTS